MTSHVSIVTLTRFPDIFDGLRFNLNAVEAQYRHRIVVTSGDAQLVAPDWSVLPGIEPFIFARNANIGIKAAGSDDVLLVNDDVRFIRPHAIRALWQAAYSDDKIGIVSPQVRGGVGNVEQMEGHCPAPVHITRERLAFVCVYIKRSLIESIGLLDERFREYGSEDLDYCTRALEAGYKCAVARAALVEHGIDGRRNSSSFLRLMTEQDRVQAMARMRKVYAEKRQAQNANA